VTAIVVCHDYYVENEADIAYKFAGSGSETMVIGGRVYKQISMASSVRRHWRGRSVPSGFITINRLRSAEGMQQTKDKQVNL